jgi:hypothetical protein
MRCLIISGFAILASAILFSMPASARTVIDYGPDVLYAYAPHHDLAKSMADLSAAMDKMDVQREAAYFLDSDHKINLGNYGSDRTPFDLKPEYAKSQQTNGLSFVETRLRC